MQLLCDLLACLSDDLSMDDTLARTFWNTVDRIRGNESLKSLCLRTNLNYDSIRNRKTGVTYSLPRLETAYLLATALHTTVEYLMSGAEDAIYPPRIKHIADHLCTIPDHALDTVEAMVMAIPSKQAVSYISPKEA